MPPLSKNSMLAAIKIGSLIQGTIKNHYREFKVLNSISDRAHSQAVNVTERRVKPRLNLPFVANVRGRNSKGELFSLKTQLDNISASGLYMRLPHSVRPGDKIVVVVYLSTLAADEPRAGRFEMHGTVIRADEQPNGRCGVAVKYSRKRLV